MSEAHPNTVTLIVPATSAHLRLARLIVSGVASLSDLDFDTIEDLRIAVDELSSLLLTEARSSGELMLEYEVNAATVEVRGTVDAAIGAGVPDVPELTRQILASVIDRYDVGAEDGQFSFSLTRSRGTVGAS